ncbi:MAG: hypothetical protein K6346_06810, partial [Halothiobacillaceae bacterium]
MRVQEDELDIHAAHFGEDLHNTETEDEPTDQEGEDEVFLAGDYGGEGVDITRLYLNDVEHHGLLT